MTKTLLNQPFVWAKIKPGAVATAYLWERGRITTNYQEISFPAGVDVKRRYSTKIEHTPYIKYDSEDYSNVKLFFYPPGYGATGNGFALSVDDVEIIKLKSVPKTFRSNATKGSVWKFNSDWTFSDYNYKEEHTIPAGTEITISNNAFKRHFIGRFEEPALEIEYNSDVAKYFTSDKYSKSTNLLLPVKEVWPHLTLIDAGARRVYWHLEDIDGKKLLDKRFKTNANLKAAIRIRLGPNEFERADDEYIPEWIDGNDYMSKIDTDNGLVAVEYDHATDDVTKEEDLSEYYVMTKLKI